MIANAIAAAMLAFALLRLVVFTGKFHWNVACGFAPFVLAFIALRQGAGRTVGGIAILLNGLLVPGGLAALTFSIVPARGPDAWNNMLAVALSASLLLAGLVNVRVLWHAFPPTPPMDIEMPEQETEHGNYDAWQPVDSENLRHLRIATCT